MPQKTAAGRRRKISGNLALAETLLVEAVMVEAVLVEAVIV